MATQVFAGFIGIVIICMVLTWLIFLTSADRHLITQKPTIFESDNVQRTYRLYIPRNTTKETKVIFALDGFGGNGRRIAYYSGLHNVATDSIVVYPDPLPAKKGQTTGWNAGFCCGSGWVEKVDDVGFITSLAKHIVVERGLSNQKFYVAGFSNGAFMAQRLAAEAPESVEAVVSFSGTIGTDKEQLELQLPVPILLVHGRSDTVVPFEGGARPSNPDFVWVSHQSTVKAWQDNNADKALVEEYVHEGGHKWTGWRILNVWQQSPGGSKRVKEFFEKF